MPRITIKRQRINNKTVCTTAKLVEAEKCNEKNTQPKRREGRRVINKQKRSENRQKQMIEINPNLLINLKTVGS